MSAHFNEGHQSQHIDIVFDVCLLRCRMVFNKVLRMLSSSGVSHQFTIFSGGDAALQAFVQVHTIMQLARLHIPCY